ncbi:MAG: NAD(P)/FAD-dependent oxidoreductase [Clostridiales bacterium]|nr:NAD(P)/FAD-dependent oxidoreductase [Clostridiales bacterium]
MNKNVVVIGAGASGLMAAAESAKLGNKVTVVEKMPKCASKVRITGKGRCNITNACFDLNELIENVPENPRFLYSAFSNFMPYDTIAFFEDLGVKTKVERGNRVFPVSDKASDVADALIKNAKNSGVKFVHARAEYFEFENNLIKAIVLDNNEKLFCESVAVCTGGKSYPATGSTGDGYRLAKQAGHSIVKIKPALVPLVCSNNFISSLQGLSLKNIAVKVFQGDRLIYSDFGEMLFTHFGVSGPVILSASSNIRSFEEGKVRIKIDLKPALDFKTLDKRLQREFSEQSNKDFINSLSKLLPKKLIPVIVSLSGISPSVKVNEITRMQRHNLAELIKDFCADVSDFYYIDSAIVTRGGVDVREIDPKTMKSKIIDNLFFAGEVIDVDAYTGGFNLQIAFSTGVLCGRNM